MSERYVAVGARRSEWDALAAEHGFSPAIGAKLKLELRIGTCSECGESMVMSEKTALEADEKGWHWICLPCVCSRSGVPYQGVPAA